MRPFLPRKPANQRARRAICWLGGLLIPFATTLAGGEREATYHVTSVRFWSLGDVTRIAVESDGDFSVRSDHLENPDRLFFDLVGTEPRIGPKGMTVIPVSDALLKQIRVAKTQHGVTRVVLDLERAADATTSRLENPNRLIIELHGMGAPDSPKSVPKAAAEVARGDTPAVQPKEPLHQEPLHRLFIAPSIRPTVSPFGKDLALLFPDQPPRVSRLRTSPNDVASIVSRIAPPLPPVALTPAPAVFAK